MSIFKNKGIFHSELVRESEREPIIMLVTSEPADSKYQGKPAWVGVKIDNVDHTISLENDDVRASFEGLKGSMIELTAFGSRDDATVEITSVAEPAQRAAARQPAQRQAPARGAAPARQQQPTQRQPERNPAQPAIFHGATVGACMNNAIKIIVENVRKDESSISNYYATPEFSKDVWEISSDLLRVSGMLEAGDLAKPVKVRAGGHAPAQEPQQEPEPEEEPAPTRRRPLPGDELDEQSEVPF